MPINVAAIAAAGPTKQRRFYDARALYDHHYDHHDDHDNIITVSAA